jgi:hypothetical protein
MEKVSFTAEELRVLRALVEDKFAGTDPVTAGDLLKRGYVQGDVAGMCLTITFTGRVALRDFDAE